jgi:hypothetical protein
MRGCKPTKPSLSLERGGRRFCYPALSKPTVPVVSIRLRHEIGARRQVAEFLYSYSRAMATIVSDFDTVNGPLRYCKLGAPGFTWRTQI